MDQIAVESHAAEWRGRRDGAAEAHGETAPIPASGPALPGDFRADVLPG